MFRLDGLGLSGIASSALGGRPLRAPTNFSAFWFSVIGTADLDSTDLSREQKAAAWYIINKGWKKNPYGGLTSENKAILDNLYGAGWQDKK